MARPIQVLVVDDALAIRTMLSRVINAEPDMDVVGLAVNGQDGVTKAQDLRPDVIVLDVHMPVMDGLEALDVLGHRLPDTPVIIFSTMSKAGADVTVKALAAGASDYSTKPSDAGSSEAATEQVKNDLVAKIRALAASRTEPDSGRPSKGAGAAGQAAATAPPVMRTGPLAPVDAIIIGSSTGGPAALEVILPRLPGNMNVPILIVQHMPPTFTSVLAGRLDKLCPFPFHEGEEGMMVEAGHGYLAPGGVHMRPRREPTGVTLALDDGPKVKSCRPSVDVMFDAASAAYEGRVLVTMLTGMGDDGLDACRRLANHDVEIIVQDNDTSVVWGMPGAVAKAGLATQCLPLDQIPDALFERAARRQGQRPRATGAMTR